MRKVECIVAPSIFLSSIAHREAPTMARSIGRCLFLRKKEKKKKRKEKKHVSKIEKKEDGICQNCRGPRHKLRQKEGLKV